MNDADLQNYVNQKIASGEFGTPEEFATEAIRVYRELEKDYRQLRDEIRSRIEQADAGQVLPLDIDSIKDQLRQEFSADGTTR